MMAKSNVKVLRVSENNYDSHAVAMPRKSKEASFTDVFKCKTKSTKACKKLCPCVCSTEKPKMFNAMYTPNFQL